MSGQKRSAPIPQRIGRRTKLLTAPRFDRQFHLGCGYAARPRGRFVSIGAEAWRKPSQGSLANEASRAGEFSTVKWEGPTPDPSSSQPRGMDTVAPGLARVE